MSKIEWEALQVQFQLARNKTGVSAKRWCEQQALGKKLGIEIIIKIP